MNHSVPSGDFTTALTTARVLEQHHTLHDDAHLGSHLVHRRYRLRHAWNRGVVAVSAGIAHLRLPEAPARASRSVAA